MEDSGNGGNHNPGNGPGGEGSSEGGEKRRRRRRRGGKGKGGGGGQGGEGRGESQPNDGTPRQAQGQQQQPREAGQGQAQGAREPRADGNWPPRDPNRPPRDQNRDRGGNAQKAGANQGPREGRGDKRGGKERGGKDRNKNAKQASAKNRDRAGGDKERLKKALAEISPKRSDLGDQPVKHVIRRYGLALYDTFAAAKADNAAIAQKAAECDQLNIVIRAEGSMDDPELLKLAPNVKLFAGNAWTIIHERRKTDGWYDEPR